MCDVCQDSGISYWSDGIYGNCLECCCIDCGKNCTCTECNKCYYRISKGEEHRYKLCVKCNKFEGCDCECFSSDSDSDFDFEFESE